MFGGQWTEIGSPGIMSDLSTFLLHERGKTVRITIFTCLSLLLSTQLYADGWIVDANSDCKIWSPDPIGPTETITYTSKCVDGKAHGKGSLTVYDNGKKFRYYEGEFINGKWQREEGSVTQYKNGGEISYHKGALENEVFPEERNTNKDVHQYSDSNLASPPFQQTM